MMDGKQLDSIARALARQTPRRTLFGGIIGGAFALFAGVTAAPAKRRSQRTRRDGRDGEESIAPGTQVGGIWDSTIDICHFNAETGGYEVMAVSTPTLPDYLNQGDTLFIDCCVSADCKARPCMIPSGCIEGACMYDPAEGAPCDLGDGTTGVCDADAMCVSTFVGEPVGVA